MGMAREDPIELRLLGPMAVLRGGAPRPLPASRKTRALLAYLAISGKPERRERLCELLWDVPDDPRGALRWSLSKLRPLVDDPGAPRLCTDGEWVELKLPDEAIDWRRLRALVRAGPAHAATADLERAAVSGGLLENLDLPRCPLFQAWCVAQREDVRQWRVAGLAELSGRDLPAETALAHIRTWVDIDGDNPAAWERLVELLERAGRAPEAAEQRRLGANRLAAAGRQIPAELRRAGARQRATGEINIRFCSSTDGAGLAYTLTGEGAPLVMAANWMTHLERDTEGPIWRHWIAAFSRRRKLLRYDQRGNGLSDRDVSFAFDAYVEDLEAVVGAAGLDRFDLIGISQSAGVAIAFAARHPERVRRLVLLGGFTRGWAKRGDIEEIARREAMLTLTREGWGLDNPAFRQLFTSLFMPDGDPEARSWLDELQRLTTSAENACAIQRVGAAMDVEDLLARISAPTLVAHCRDDAMVPFESGRAMARAIPGARFLPLDSRNHMLLENDAAWLRFRDAALSFLDG